MIVSFASRQAADLYHGVSGKRSRRVPGELRAKTRRLLDQLNAAPSVEFMRIPPGNRLEKLSGELKGFWSVRINEQWRVIFRWQGDDAYDIDIVDYH